MGAVLFGPQKMAKQTRRKPGPGQYSLEDRELSWHRCREQFAKIFRGNQKGLFFSHSVNKGECVASFLSHVEDILLYGGLHNFEKSSFSKTNLNFALWVEPSHFWMVCPLRRSLLTILLRAGLKYDQKNFEEALYSYPYIKDTKIAVQRFLFGFTYSSFNEKSLEGSGRGWKAVFKGKSRDYIRSKLSRPDDIDDSCLVGVGSLWN